MSVETAAEARRVVESYFPDTIFVEDVELIDDKMVQDGALRFSSVGVVIIGAGPPCQGVSGLNADRRGALRDCKSCLFAHVLRVTQLVRKIFVWAQVHCMVENVASMDYEDCQLMSEAYETEPWFFLMLGGEFAQETPLVLAVLGTSGVRSFNAGVRI